MRRTLPRPARVVTYASTAAISAVAAACVVTALLLGMLTAAIVTAPSMPSAPACTTGGTPR